MDSQVSDKLRCDCCGKWIEPGVDMVTLGGIDHPNAEDVAIRYSCYKKHDEAHWLKWLNKQFGEIYRRDDAFQFASRKAQYGHKSWIAWRNKKGERFCARMTHNTLKAALLAIGTQGQFNYYQGDATGMLCNWQLGVKWFRFPQFYIDGKYQ